MAASVLCLCLVIIIIGGLFHGIPEANQLESLLNEKQNMMVATCVTFFSQKLFSYQVLNLGNSIKTFRFIVMVIAGPPPPACLLVMILSRGV